MSVSVDWSNILIPAGVAAIVTLAIEYAAKPWLEARKERILDRYRVKARIDQHLNSAFTGMVAISSLNLVLANNEQARELGRLEAERLQHEVGDAATGLFRDASQLTSMDQATMSLLVRLSAVIRAYAIGPLRPGEPVDPSVFAQFKLLGQVLPRARWSWRARRGRQQIAAWLAENDGGA